MESKQEELVPAPINRNLSIIFDKYSEYNTANTMIISNFPNKNSAYTDNDLIIPLFHPAKGTTEFTSDAHLHFLNEYILFLMGLLGSGNGMELNLVQDIREGIKQLNYDKLVKIRTGTSRLSPFAGGGNVRF